MSPLLRVLMLIDIMAGADMLAHELRHAGFELTVRHAGTEAAYLAELEAPLDLILADNALPAFDAMRALQILRTSERDIPLIVVTESAGEPAAIECVSLGAADFVFKDQPARLRSAVIRALDQRALRVHARAADAALRQSAAINQAVLDSLTAHIAVLNRDGVLIAVNQAWERFARASGDVDMAHTGVGTSYLDVCQPAIGPNSAEAQPAAQGIAAVLARELDQFMIEYPCHSPTEERWFVMRVTPLAGEHSGAVVAHENITARKRSEEALRESEERFRSAYEYAAIGMALVGLDGRWLQANRALCDFTGYTEPELLATTFQAITHPDDLALDLTNMRALMAGEIHSFQIEKRYFHKHGATIWVLLSVSLVRDAQRLPRYFVNQIQDITERKQAERVLRQKTALIQLFQEVAAAANQATSLDQALQTAVDAICEHIGWPIGHVYLPDPAEPGALLPTHIWHLEDAQRFAAFRNITEVVRLAPGIGLPGQALASRQAAWVADMNLDVSTPRTRVIQQSGVRAGFALPVLLGDEVAAVLEFFATEAIEPDAALLEVLHHIGTQLGRVVERARAEAATRESEARFRVLFEHSPDAIILIDPHNSGVLWPIVACNELAGRMNGYTRDELIGQSIDLLNAVVGTLAEREAYIERLRREGTLQFDGVHRRKDGSLFPIEVVSSLITVAGRELVLGIDRDISERKRAEDALRAAEARYRTLVEQLPAIIYTAEINEQSTTQYVSPQVEAMLGFSPEEWLANPDLWLERVHPDDRVRIIETIGRVQASDVPIPTEYRSFTRDGRVVWLRDTERVVRDESGRPLYLQGITVDITDRKRAEEALHASERLYRTLASNFPNGAVVLFDPDLRFTIADGAGLRAFGLTREAMEGRTIWEIAAPALGLDAEADYRAALAGTPQVREITLGAHTYVVHTLPVRDARGAIIAGMLMSQDITERKRIEEALIDERALLARRVDERTADLSAANAELARVAILKDEFLASMSHELRTPLNAVLGLSEALQEAVYGPVTDRQRRTLHSIAESGRHLLDLINDILDLAKIGAGKLELELEPTAIAPLCQASLRLITQIAHNNHLAVDLTIDPAVTLLHIDARRVKQILVNLLSNAVKFTPAGGAIGLEVVGDAARQAVDLTVWDTGIGMAHEHMGNLFQPFVQLDSRLARQYEGTGLGLALVYRMVELHGGSMAVTSEVGHGSRFTVALPWPTPNTDADAHAPAAPDVVELDRTPIRHALIVEDSPTTAEQITRYLHELAITSDTVCDGEGVVALAITEPPDLILLDLLLADSSGWDVLAQLKAEPRTRAIPVVIISVIDECARGLALGAADYLVKPVARDNFQRVLLELTAHGNALQPARREGVLAARTLPPPLVLLAEDNEANITLIADYLGTRGYQVVVARNGAEAITRARESRPAIILMDIQMPGMDGLEATRRIRTVDDLADLPIIALTALAMPGDRERCLAAGANDYLCKPVSLRGLANLIEHTLQPHSSQQRNPP